tara:strand:+ start:2264 stop:3718 length:1455 start_codon:yes stop_codon:yes gene_type:complete
VERWLALLEANAHIAATLKHRARNYEYAKIAKQLEIAIEDARLFAAWIRKSAPKATETREHLDAGIESDDQYTFNKAAGTYVFHLSKAAAPVVLSIDRVNAIVADYSSAVGKPATVNQISRAHNMPRTTVIHVLRALGVTHDSLPWTPEHIEDSHIETLKREAEELSALDVYKAIEKDKWRRIQNDADNFRRFRERIIAPTKQWFKDNAPTYDPPRLSLHKSREEYVVLFGLTDEHYGKYAGKYTGAPWNRETQKRVTMRVLERLIARVATLGRPLKIIVPIGSDGLHIDTMDAKTTRGTPQDVDGHPREMISEWIQFKAEQLDLLSQLGAQVEGWLCPGNHDAMASIWLCAALEGWFAKNDRVNFRGLDNLNPIQVGIYGDTLIGLYHGDRLDVRALSQIIPRDFPKIWGQSKYRYLFTGHFHSDREINTRSDLIVRRLPTVCGTDDWHYQSGYKGRRSIQAHAITERGGLVQTFDEPIMDGD